jgi:hypothetical protein
MKYSVEFTIKPLYEVIDFRIFNFFICPVKQLAGGIL